MGGDYQNYGACKKNKNSRRGREGRENLAKKKNRNSFMCAQGGGGRPLFRSRPPRVKEPSRFLQRRRKGVTKEKET